MKREPVNISENKDLTINILEARCADQEHLLKDYENMHRIVKWQAEMLSKAKHIIEMVETVDEPIEDWISDLEKGVPQ